LQKIDKNAAGLLRINCGEYRLNLNVFDKNFNLDVVPRNEEDKSETHENDLESHEDENYEYHDKRFHEEHIESSTINLNTSPETVKNMNQNEIHNLEIPSLDCTEVNNIIRSTQELTNLTNISDIVGDKIEGNSNICLNKSPDILLHQSFNENAICDNLPEIRPKKLPLLDLSTELFQ
jgi:ATP-dependent 26S proteasome regulatory subunit